MSKVRVSVATFEKWRWYIGNETKSVNINIYIYSFAILFLNYSDCSDKTDVVKIIIIFTISNIFLLYFIHYTNDITYHKCNSFLSFLIIYYVSFHTFQRIINTLIGTMIHRKPCSINYNITLLWKLYNLCNEEIHNYRSVY